MRKIKKNIILSVHSLKLPWIIKNLMFKLINTPTRAQVKLFNGMIIEIDPRDSQAFLLIKRGIYEPLLTRVFTKFIKIGDIVFDIGANIGYFSLLANSLITDKGRCYAFEPIKSNVAFIHTNVALNHINNITVIEKFVGDTCDNLVEMSAPRIDNRGAGSIVDIPRRSKTKVSTITLDDFCKRNELNKIDFLKMDIEGGEALAIKGMSEGIKAHVYKNLAIEFHERQLTMLGTPSLELKELFTIHGYRAYEIYPPSFLIDRTDTGLQGSYMFFMAPGTPLYGQRRAKIDL